LTLVSRKPGAILCDGLMIEVSSSPHVDEDLPAVLDVAGGKAEAGAGVGARVAGQRHRGEARDQQLPGGPHGVTAFRFLSRPRDARRQWTV